MKQMNKVLALVMVLAMALSLSVTAFAAETTYSITIMNDKPGHTYEAYQIFAGDLHNAGEDADGNTSAVLSNITWADGVTYEGAGVVVGKDSDDKDILSKEAGDIAEALKEGSLSISALLADLKLGAADGTTSEHLKDNAGNGVKYVISGLKPGYYLVKDAEENKPLNGKYDAYTNYILEVIEDSVVTPKTSVPTVTKKVDDKNSSDHSEDSVTWSDSADYNIGEDVPFMLTATMPSNLSSYTKYAVVFHDTMCKGLTLNAQYTKDAQDKDTTVVASGISVKMGSADLTSNFAITAVKQANGETKITLTCADVKALGATNGSVITVEYTAKLNENAVIGVPGNPNEVYLEYSNNPNYTGNGVPGDPENPPPTGNTPKDKVVVFTYKLVVDKTDNKGNPLNGATFELQKWIAGDGNEGKWTTIKKIDGASMTQFTFDGLDAGRYKLVETIVPAGYNKAADIEFTISANSDLNADEPQLYEITITGADITVVKDQNDMPTGELTMTVENRPGTVLPETGGMGTTLFYIVGGLLVAAAVVLLVTKKRMASAE